AVGVVGPDVPDDFIGDREREPGEPVELQRLELDAHGRVARLDVRGGIERPRDGAVPLPRKVQVNVQGAVGRARDLMAPVQHGEPDRKSTRLNSSHDQISYAVFCLKKKKYSSRLSAATLRWSSFRIPAAPCASL